MTLFLLTCPLNLIAKTRKELNLPVISKPVALKCLLILITSERVNGILSTLNSPLVILSAFIANVYAIV
jgi:hypothetical protein